MEKKFNLIHGEDNTSGIVTDFETVNRIDQAVAEARDVAMTSSNIAMNQTFFMMSGFSPALIAFAIY